MSKKLKFHFTEGHTHVATGVTQTSNWNAKKEFSYTSATEKENFTYKTFKEKDGIVTHSTVEVPMHDVLYIEVHSENGHVEIIPGLITSFTVVPNAAQVAKVQADLDATKKADAKFLKEKEIKRQKTAQRKKEQHAKHLGITVEQLETLHKK